MGLIFSFLFDFLSYELLKLKRQTNLNSFSSNFSPPSIRKSRKTIVRVIVTVGNDDQSPMTLTANRQCLGL